MSATEIDPHDEPRQHAVIVGCGRVGSGLAERFAAAGYTVAVIDTDRTAFRRLGDLDVGRHVGVGFDRSTMASAGIERAVAVAAVTNGDNTNIVVARTAAEHFHVPRVIARIYDSRRAAIYERLGTSTDLVNFADGNPLSCGAWATYPTICSFVFPIGEYVAGGGVQTIPGFEATSVIDYLP